ncbi:MAG: hypothetical protein R6X02_30420 [Enhygromyxa sp.]
MLQGIRVRTGRQELPGLGPASRHRVDLTSLDHPLVHAPRQLRRDVPAEPKERYEQRQDVAVRDHDATLHVVVGDRNSHPCSLAFRNACRTELHMRRRSPNSWTLLCIMTLGLLVLMASARPELQRQPGKESAPGPALAITGHVLSWTPGAVLVYRMLRAAQQHTRDERQSDDA